MQLDPVLVGIHSNHFQTRQIDSLRSFDSYRDTTVKSWPRTSAWPPSWNVRPCLEKIWDLCSRKRSEWLSSAPEQSAAVSFYKITWNNSFKNINLNVWKKLSSCAICWRKDEHHLKIFSNLIQSVNSVSSCLERHRRDSPRLPLSIGRRWFKGNKMAAVYLSIEPSSWAQLVKCWQ